MKQLEKQALFIIDSAFQALCASEAILHFGIEDVHYALEEDDIVRRMTYPLIKEKGEIHIIEKKKIAPSTNQWYINARKAISNRFDLIFIGDYYSYWQYVVASSVSTMFARIIYLDDGNSTLSIIPPESRTRGFGRGKIWFKCWDIFNGFKFIKKSLYTLFDLGCNCPLPYEMHDFSSLVGVKNKGVKQDGIYVIGTNTNQLVIRDYSYPEYLSLLDNYIKSIFPDDHIYYCPHRMDPTDYSTEIKSMGWDMFDTSYSVEVDFVIKGINPKMVIGFGSTALFTLKKMFKQSQVCTVYMDLTNESYNISYRAIEAYYAQNGIPTVKM